VTSDDTHFFLSSQPLCTNFGVLEPNIPWHEVTSFRMSSLLIAEPTFCCLWLSAILFKFDWYHEYRAPFHVFCLWYFVSKKKSKQLDPKKPPKGLPLTDEDVSGDSSTSAAHRHSFPWTPQGPRAGLASANNSSGATGSSSSSSNGSIVGAHATAPPAADAMPLTADHTPMLVAERERIERCGGKVGTCTTCRLFPGVLCAGGWEKGIPKAGSDCI